jgi:exopolysaccharide biosynthesis polyprenyl glycosylphosphotransferase
MEENLLLKPAVIQPGHRVLPIQLAEHRNILLTVDALLVNVALLIGLWLGAQRSNWVFSFDLILSYIPWFASVTVIYFILATANDAYRPKVASDPVASFIAIIKTIFQIFILYLLIYSLLPPYSLPRHFIGFFTLISPFLIVGWRRFYNLVFTIPVFQHKTIIIGAGWAGKTILKTLKDFAPSHIEVIGFVDDDQAKQQQFIEDVPIIGSITQLPVLIRQKQVTDVVLAINHNLQGHVLASLMECYEQGIRVSSMSELYERLTDRVPVEHIGDDWFVILPFSNNGQHLTYRIAKRLLDICISMIGLVIFALILPFLIFVLIIDSPGPIFYRQKRVGKGGKVFELIKLRSMVVDAEQDGRARWADKQDARVTRFGHFLRSTRLDEAPQLWNVLHGEMSLIGPRPERPEFVVGLEQEIPFYRTRLTVKPGLTGWAQVNYDYGRSVVDALEKLRYDLYYIKHQSLQLDLVIVLKTISTILLLKGI